MEATVSLLNPNQVRARLFKGAEGAGKAVKDAGMNLIETMAVMAIVAIIALGAGPQVAKFIERANVQNIIGDVRNAAMEIESDFSISGQSIYSTAVINAGIAKANTTAQNVITGAQTPANTTLGYVLGRGFTLEGKNPGVSKYKVTYNSLDSQVKVVPVP